MQDNESIAKKVLEWKLQVGRRKTQDYMAKHSDNERTSWEELSGNRIYTQKQDPMANFRKGPKPL
jgi:hypothetical protein